MSAARIRDPRPTLGVISAIGAALPAAREAAAAAVDRVDALERLLEAAAVVAHGRGATEILVGELLIDQADEHERAGVRALLARAGISHEREDRDADIARAAAAVATRATAQG
jgi:hypothetical protein